MTLDDDGTLFESWMQEQRKVHPARRKFIPKPSPVQCVSWGVYFELKVGYAPASTISWMNYALIRAGHPS